MKENKIIKGLKDCNAQYTQWWHRLTVLFPAATFASTDNAIDLHALKTTFLGAIDPSDLSLNYMANVFSYLGGGNTLTPLIGEMIKYFNFGVLFFIAGIVTYTTSMHVIKTANQGSAMGKKSGAATSIFRVATSISFAVPLPAYGGFCALQLFVLNVVLQGIGIANYAWDGVIAIYNNSGSILPMALRAQPLKQGDTQVAAVENLGHLATQSTQLINTQLCHVYNQSLAKAKAARAMADQQAAQGRDIVNTNTVTDLDQIIRFTAPQNGQPGRIDSALEGDDYLPCPIITFSGQLAYENQYATSISANEKANIIAARWALFKQHYQALLHQVTLPMYAVQRLDHDGDVAMSQCIYDDKSNVQPVRGCYLLPTFNSVVRIYQQRLTALNQIEFKRLLGEGVLAKPNNTPAPLDAQLGWLSAGLFYHQILGTTASDTLETLFNRYNAMGSDALLQGFSDFNIGTIQKDTTSNVYDYMNHPISSEGYHPLRRVWQLMNTGKAFTDQGATCNVLSQNINCQSYAYVTHDLANRSLPVPDATNALQQLKSKMSQAAYQLMPKGGLSANNYQDAVSQVAQEKQHRDRDIMQLLRCAGLPMSLDFSSSLPKMPSATSSTNTPQANTSGMTSAISNSPVFSTHDQCPNGGSASNNPLGFIFSIFTPLKNIFTPSSELQSAGFGGDVHSRSLFIDQDIRIFIVDMVDAWFKMLAQEPSVHGGKINHDPLTNLRDFGIASTAAGYAFLVRVTQDIWISNYVAFMKSFFNQLKYSLLAAPLWKGARITNTIGDVFIDMAAIPIIGPIFWIIGEALKFGSIFPNLISTYFTSLANSAMLAYPIVLVSQTLYSMVSIAVVVVVMTLGIMFATYIPMLPFIIFTFTAIGWMMSVIEAVIAAPIVAAGVASPQGHDFLGKAQQIGMMLASAMMRPICILIGFLMAILVFIASVKLLNVLFVAFINQMVIADGATSLGSSVSLLLMMYAYGLVLYSLVDFVFALTHLLPTFVVRWIGLRPVDAGEAHAILGVESGIRDNLIGGGLAGVSRNAGQFQKSIG